jgi:hypothetical protein
MSIPKFEMPNMSHVAIGKSVSWYEASARQRVRLLLDAGSFEEFIGPEQREISPHLRLFDLPAQFDDGIVVGRGRIAGAPVFLAAQEGRFMGGAFGESSPTSQRAWISSPNRSPTRSNGRLAWKAARKPERALFSNSAPAAR